MILVYDMSKILIRRVKSMTYTETLDMNEFVLKLSQEQKTVFLKALAFLANIDNHFDREELKFIRDAAVKYGIDEPDILFKPISEDEMLNELKQLKDRRVCLELIKELCLLGHADSNLSDEETLFIGHAGLTMGIELEKIEQISDWVVDKIMWLERGKIIFEDL